MKRLLMRAVILSLIFAVGCRPALSNNVKVVISTPMGTSYGRETFQAAELAVQKAGGKAGKYNVELVVLSESEPDSENVSTPLVIQNAEQAVNDPAVVGWLGPDSSRTAKEIIPILNRAYITQVSGSNTWPGLTKPGYELGEPGIYYPTGRRNYFRTVASDEIQGAAAARWIQQLGYKNVYILYGSDVYGTGVAGVFEITAKDIGLSVTGKNAFETEAALSPEITSPLAENALNSNPDVIFLAGSVGSNAEHIAIALRQADTEIPIIGPDGLAVPDLIALLGPDLSKNMYSTVVAIPPEELNTPAAIDFVQSFEAAYGTRPSPSAGAMYEAASVLLYAISRAEKPTREAVLESMQNLGEYTGIFGTWRFNEQGDITPSGISGMKIQDGDWVFVNALK